VLLSVTVGQVRVCVRCQAAACGSANTQLMNQADWQAAARQSVSAHLLQALA
jgi:hypothetical protein